MTSNLIVKQLQSIQINIPHHRLTFENQHKNRFCLNCIKKETTTKPTTDAINLKTIYYLICIQQQQQQ